MDIVGRVVATYISGQSYKAPTIVICVFRVVNIINLLVCMALGRVVIYACRGFKSSTTEEPRLKPGCINFYLALIVPLWKRWKCRKRWREFAILRIKEYSLCTFPKFWWQISFSKFHKIKQTREWNRKHAQNKNFNCRISS